MAKYIQRIGSEKRTFIIEANIHSIRTTVTEDTEFQIIWKRGATLEETTPVEYKKGENEVKIFQSFS